MKDADYDRLFKYTNLSIVLYLFYLWTIDKSKPYTVNELVTKCTPPGKGDTISGLETNIFALKMMVKKCLDFLKFY